MPNNWNELHGIGSTSVRVFLSAVTVLLLQLLSRFSAPQAHSINERKGQQACAECLGIVGAIDPARVSLQAAPPPRLAIGQHALLVTLLTEHLVRILRVAPSLQVLDAASVAIQVDSEAPLICWWCSAPLPLGDPSTTILRTPC